MPYSACTTCHSRPDDDAAMWLQDTIDQRQDWTHDKVDEIKATLERAALHLGYKPNPTSTPPMTATDVARDALVAVPQNQWTTAERAFLSGFTNVEFVESEGSFGLHNWDYSREIVNVALSQARIAETGVIVRLPWKVTLKMSKTSVKVNTKVTFSGTVMTAKGVPGAGQVSIMRLIEGSGQWTRWQRVTLTSTGTFSRTVTVKSKGTYHIRATMPSDSLNSSASSTPTLKLVVK